MLHRNLGIDALNLNHGQDTRANRTRHTTSSSTQSHELTHAGTGDPSSLSTLESGLSCFDRGSSESHTFTFTQPLHTKADPHDAGGTLHTCIKFRSCNNRIFLLLFLFAARAQAMRLFSGSISIGY